MCINLQLSNTVPDPVVAITPPGLTVVGRPLVINCTVTTVDGVEPSALLIRWTGPAITSERFTSDNIISIGNNTYIRTLRVSYLVKSDENDRYLCLALIMGTSDIDSIVLNSLLGEVTKIINSCVLQHVFNIETPSTKYFACYF